MKITPLSVEKSLFFQERVPFSSKVQPSKPAIKKSPTRNIKIPSPKVPFSRPTMSFLSQEIISTRPTILSPRPVIHLPRPTVLFPSQEIFSTRPMISFSSTKTFSPMPTIPFPRPTVQSTPPMVLSPPVNDQITRLKTTLDNDYTIKLLKKSMEFSTYYWFRELWVLSICN